MVSDTRPTFTFRVSTIGFDHLDGEMVMAERGDGTPQLSLASLLGAGEQDDLQRRIVASGDAGHGPLGCCG